jgi:hypothetical protein
MAELFDLPQANIEPDYSSRNEVIQLRPMNAMLDTTTSFEIVDNYEPEIKFSEAIKDALKRFI